MENDGKSPVCNFGQKIGELMEGAVDLHYHGFPDTSIQEGHRIDNVEVLEMARSYGMLGIVFKSNFWPTMIQVYELRRRISGINIFGSITLNPVVGGLNPGVVEMAAEQGAKVIWMPTWSSSHGLSSDSVNLFNGLVKKRCPSFELGNGLTICDSSGKLLPNVKVIVKLAKDFNMVLGTGHLSPRESLSLANEAEKIGFAKLIFTHPLRPGYATVEELREMVRRGAYIEVTSLNVFVHGQLNQVIQVIQDLGARHFILSSDAAHEWQPPGPEFLRMLVGRLVSSGISKEDVRTMVRTNPAKLLDLVPAGMSLTL